MFNQSRRWAHTRRSLVLFMPAYVHIYSDVCENEIVLARTPPQARVYLHMPSILYCLCNASSLYTIACWARGTGPSYRALQTNMPPHIGIDDTAYLQLDIQYNMWCKELLNHHSSNYHSRVKYWLCCINIHGRDSYSEKLGRKTWCCQCYIVYPAVNRQYHQYL